jgi:hypothetical protein
MEVGYKYCAPFLSTFGYPPTIMIACNSFFKEWVESVLKESSELEWWKTRLAQDSDPLIRSTFGFWLACQLYNKRKELVAVVRKRQEPDIVSELPDDQRIANMNAWLVWFKEDRQILIDFLKIPDMDSKTIESSNALCLAPKTKRARLQEATFAFFSCSLKVGETEHVIGGFYNEKIPFFAIFPLLSRIGMNSVPMEKVRRLTAEEVTFLEHLPKCDLLTIFALEENWRMQSVISKPTFDALLETEEWKTCPKPIFIKF